MTTQLTNENLARFDEFARNLPLIAEFTDYLVASGMKVSSTKDFPGPAKHFLAWINEVGIKLEDVDTDVVVRFLSHKCECTRPYGSRFQSRHLGSHQTGKRVMRFARFLEDNQKCNIEVYTDGGLQRVSEFIAYLSEQSYTQGTINGYKACCLHFVTWLRVCRIKHSEIDDAIVQRFFNHECLCPGFFVQDATRNRNYQFKIKRFVHFLSLIGVTKSQSAATNSTGDALPEFRDWLRRNRGASEGVHLAHAKCVMKLLPQLGDDPKLYDAALINAVMLENLKTNSRTNAQRLSMSLRMYLRFLAAMGACSPGLVGAIPRIPRWRLATLPRYIVDDEVERVIASCDLTLPRGLRDHAILLLLARLALRAGDIVNLSLEDIDWENALIRVSGKSRRAVALPLPQDAGDALLAYIERVRPSSTSTRVFMRSIAPSKPLASTGAVSSAVYDALKRAGVDNANLRGAYLLRHSAATNMLRSGATLDAVGAILRHRSPETTAIYAKVDTTMLAKVVQPWIGGATCR